MMKYSNLDDRSYYIRAQHICQAAGVIKSRILHRRRFRELLFQAAQKAIESGARPTALQCYETCIDLMQPDPWIEDDQDVSYDETLSVYTKAAELYWHQGRHPDAEKLLESTFKGARSAADRAPSWVLRSRIYAARGNVLEAFKSYVHHTHFAMLNNKMVVLKQAWLS